MRATFYNFFFIFYIISHHNVEKILSYSSHISFIEGTKKNGFNEGKWNFIWKWWWHHYFSLMDKYIQAQLYTFNIYTHIIFFTNKEIHFLQLENPFNEIAFFTHTPFLQFHSYVLHVVQCVCAMVKMPQIVTFSCSLFFFSFTFIVGEKPRHIYYVHACAHVERKSKTFFFIILL